MHLQLQKLQVVQKYSPFLYSYILQKLGMYGASSGACLGQHLGHMVCWRFYLGPPQAHGDPAPLGPKERKLKREELVFYQFIQAAGQKVSPLTGS